MFLIHAPAAIKKQSQHHRMQKAKEPVEKLLGIRSLVYGGLWYSIPISWWSCLQKLVGTWALAYSYIESNKIITCKKLITNRLLACSLAQTCMQQRRQVNLVCWTNTAARNENEKCERTCMPSSYILSQKKYLTKIKQHYPILFGNSTPEMLII